MDLIERQEAIDAVASYLYKVCLAFHSCMTHEESKECATCVLQPVPSATQSNTHNTLEALDALERILNHCEEIDLHLPEAERSGYKMLPDYEVVRKALAERKHGRWRPIQIGKWHGLECSVCKVSRDVPCGNNGIPQWKYCPECGARMDGDENG